MLVLRTHDRVRNRLNRGQLCILKENVATLRPRFATHRGTALNLKPSVNWLFVFIPVTLAAEHFHTSPPVVFFSAALAVVPIACLIVASTEQLAHRTGDAIGGLLNATFGNAPELIIAFVALKAGYADMVRASIVGAVLANMLLGMGIAFFLGGLRHRTQVYNAGVARLYSSMMLISAMSLAVPSVFSRFFLSEATSAGGGAAGFPQQNTINIVTASFLLVAYAAYLIFLLKTHPDYFKSAAAADGAEGNGGEDSQGHSGGKSWSAGKAIGCLVGASALAAWMSEILVGAAQGTGESLGMSQTFIAIVLLAVVGGAAETGSAIAMGRKNKPDLTVGIAMGSSIQIVLFVAPALVFVSYFIGPAPLQLTFTRAEVGTLFLAVLIGAFVAGDGRSNWYKGFQLIVVYATIALLFYFLPST